MVKEGIIREKQKMENIKNTNKTLNLVTLPLKGARGMSHSPFEGAREMYHSPFEGAREMYHSPFEGGQGDVLLFP